MFYNLPWYVIVENRVVDPDPNLQKKARSGSDLKEQPANFLFMLIDKKYLIFPIFVMYIFKKIYVVTYFFDYVRPDPMAY